LSFDVAGFTQSLAKRGNIRCIRAGNRAAAEKTDHRHPLLLRARRQRPRKHRAEADQKFAASSHSMISSARTRIGGGISIPKACAAFSVVTRSELGESCVGNA